ncbi:MAG: hypothetical protein MJZ65_02380 [Paludibacteraceae bacterium]|nr:hypothetical protein [Paludibacteraceae bacterium]
MRHLLIKFASIIVLIVALEIVRVVVKQHVLDIVAGNVQIFVFLLVVEGVGHHVVAVEINAQVLVNSHVKTLALGVLDLAKIHVAVVVLTLVKGHVFLYVVVLVFPVVVTKIVGKNGKDLQDPRGVMEMWNCKKHHIYCYKRLPACL